MDLYTISANTSLERKDNHQIGLPLTENIGLWNCPENEKISYIKFNFFHFLIPFLK